MKPFNLILLLVFSQVAAREVKVRVMDELGSPVVGAKSSIYFVNARHDDLRAGLTDKNGVFSASGSSSNSFGFIITKEGHYQARVEGLSKDRDHDVEVVLPRIINPIPLFVWNGHDPHSVMIPARNQWIGFDFEAADWVAPHGNGKTADFLLRFRNEFKGWSPSQASFEERIEGHKDFYKRIKKEWTMEAFKIAAGDWEGVMELSFPGEGEGVFEEKRFLAYSPMKLPHLAPEAGYASFKRFEVSDFNGIPRRDDTGYFLRTRIKRDGEGKIVSANYAKVIGDFNVNAATGKFEMIYYFNPTPNDRNLEFDPDKNLFPKDKPGTNVYNP